MNPAVGRVQELKIKNSASLPMGSGVVRGMARFCCDFNTVLIGLVDVNEGRKSAD
jgi:hypothetical protein